MNTIIKMSVTLLICINLYASNEPKKVQKKHWCCFSSKKRAQNSLWQINISSNSNPSIGSSISSSSSSTPADVSSHSSSTSSTTINGDDSAKFKEHFTSGGTRFMIDESGKFWRI